MYLAQFQVAVDQGTGIQELKAVSHIHCTKQSFVWMLARCAQLFSAFIQRKAPDLEIVLADHVQGKSSNRRQQANLI